MFVAREKELQLITQELAAPGHSAILVYGKRRVGKSMLIEEASRSFNGIRILHMCIQSTVVGNIALLCESIGDALGMPGIRFLNLEEIFRFLGMQTKKILLVLDEYSYFKDSGKKGEIDSLMQSIIDHMPENVKLILCGSYITTMKELLAEDNPLFGRFRLVIHLQEMDYRDAAGFYPDMSVMERVANYAVWGGSPYVLANVDWQKSMEENICRYLLPPTGILRIYIENVILREIQKAYDVRIFAVIGNGRKRYSDIKSALGGDGNGLLGKQIKNLISMEAISKVAPINRPDDNKKQFYVISDNLMRFYFTYLFGRTNQIVRLGEHAYYREYISSSLTEFISRRFEDIACQYFMHLSRIGQLTGVLDIGTYWYDDAVKRTNGEFDCVLHRKDSYDFYECKYYHAPMTEGECRKEEEQVRNAAGKHVGQIGFICTAGFEKRNERYILIEGEQLYA